MYARVFTLSKTTTSWQVMVIRGGFYILTKGKWIYLSTKMNGTKPGNSNKMGNK